MCLGFKGLGIMTGLGLVRGIIYELQSRVLNLVLAAGIMYELRSVFLIDGHGFHSGEDTRNYAKLPNGPYCFPRGRICFRIGIHVEQKVLYLIAGALPVIEIPGLTCRNAIANLAF